MSYTISNITPNEFQMKTNAKLNRACVYKNITQLLTPPGDKEKLASPLRASQVVFLYMSKFLLRQYETEICVKIK